MSMANLFSIYGQMEKLEEAEVLGLEVIKKGKQIFGEDDADTLGTMSHLAAIYIILGKFTESEELVITRRKRVLGEEHSDTLDAMSRLVGTYILMHRDRDAEELSETIENIRKVR